ncbi:MAG TPA: phage holin family protein [Pirellulaceae bacterium]|nr:phage holin family protein [Pirellulaceae bacterium]
MENQTKLNEQNGLPETAPRAMARNVGEFAHDVLTLAELQVQLFVADAQECGRRVLVPGLVLLGGVVLGLTCLPIALAALALLVIQVFEISYAAGFLIAVVVGAVVSALLCAIGLFQVRQSVTVLGRSQQELVRNLRWVKKVLERSRITRRNGIDNSWRTVK